MRSLFLLISLQSFVLFSRHCIQLNKLQLAVFSESRDGLFRDFAVANPAAYESRERLTDFLYQLSVEQLFNLAIKFNFLSPNQRDSGGLGDSASDPVPAAKKRKVDRTTLSAFPPQFPDKLFQKDMLIKVFLSAVVISVFCLDLGLNSASLF